LRHIRLGKRPAHRRLVARACDGEWWIVRQAETLGGERRGHHALIIDAHDRRERRVMGAGDDHLGGSSRVRRSQRQRTFTHRRRHRCRAIGGHRYRHP